jgi:hypothetical protein
MKASERIATMVHAFDDAGRKDEVRRLAESVAQLEAVAHAARTLVTWKDQLSFGLNKRRLVDALAALDEAT